MTATTTTAQAATANYRTEPPDSGVPGKALAAARFQVFAFLFALATLLYHRWGWYSLSLEAVPLIAATLVLLKPSSTWRFLLFVALQTVYAYRDLPDSNTNRTLMVILGATILCAWLVVRLRSGRMPAPAGWLRCFEPALRLELLAIYFWACWHKLNVDFFDIEKSCGVVLYQRVAERLPWLPLPTGEHALTAVVFGTVAVEGLLPLCLLFRRTRNLGLLLGVGLHFGFGLTMFYDFSMMMLALLFLFAPPALAHALLNTPQLSLRARLGLSPKQWSWIVPLAVLCGIVATKIVFWDMFKCFSILWWSLPLFVGIAVWIVRRQRLQHARTAELLRVGPIMAVFPLAVFLNGACPYLGSKTETAFAMYSNLRTEGGRTNHFLMQESLDLFDYQTDLVTIRASSDPVLSKLAEAGRQVPFYVLRKRVWEVSESGTSPVSLTFTRGGREISLGAAERDPELSEAPSYFERKFLRFREILPYDANYCSH